MATSTRKCTKYTNRICTPRLSGAKQAGVPGRLVDWEAVRFRPVGDRISWETHTLGVRDGPVAPVFEIV